MNTGFLPSFPFSWHNKRFTHDGILTVFFVCCCCYYCSCSVDRGSTETDDIRWCRLNAQNTNKRQPIFMRLMKYAYECVRVFIKQRFHLSWNIVYLMRSTNWDCCWCKYVNIFHACASEIFIGFVNACLDNAYLFINRSLQKKGRNDGESWSNLTLSRISDNMGGLFLLFTT